MAYHHCYPAGVMPTLPSWFAASVLSPHRVPEGAPDTLLRNKFRQIGDHSANYSINKPSILIDNIVGFNQQFR
jgi:hypothetical protein